jgi:hypothetical protein
MKLKDASQLEAILPSITASGVFCSMVTETSMDSYLAKPKSNPYVGRLTKRSKVSDVYLYQGEYENLVNNRRDKNDLDKTFEAVAPKGMHHVDGHPLLLQSDKDANKYYLRTYYPKNQNTRTHVEYLLDGKIVDINTLKESIVPSYFAEKKEGVSQGLDTETAIIVRSIGLEGVKELKVGNYHFSE